MDENDQKNGFRFSRLKEWCRCTKVSKNINWNGGVIVSETRSARCNRKICQCNTVTSKTSSEFRNFYTHSHQISGNSISPSRIIRLVPKCYRRPFAGMEENEFFHVSKANVPQFNSWKESCERSPYSVAITPKCIRDSDANYFQEFLVKNKKKPNGSEMYWYSRGDIPYFQLLRVSTEFISEYRSATLNSKSSIFNSEFLTPKPKSSILFRLLIVTRLSVWYLKIRAYSFITNKYRE